jgi:small subunit ribosomal protein S9
MADESQTPELPEEEQVSQAQSGEQPAESAAEPVVEQSAAESEMEQSAAESEMEQSAAESEVEQSAAEPEVEQSAAAEPVAEEPAAEPATEAPAASDAEPREEGEYEEPAPAREKPAVPGAHLEVDIVPEGVDPLAPEQPLDPYAIEEYEEPQAVEEEEEPDDGGALLAQPISTAAIDLAAGARYRATGKRKTAIARVILKPGSGVYTINGRPLEQHFPRITLQRNIRQPLETVGYEERMDVTARLHGSGISAQAGALRHGISRALLEADPNLRGELKRRGFLTRDSRAKERKKAGLKKARKRPQFSKR